MIKSIRNYLLILAIILSTGSALAVSKNLSLIIPKSELINSADEKKITEYAKALGKDTKNNWYPKEYNGKLRSIVKVHFSETGEANTEINESSGDLSFDESALAALDRSLPSNFIYKNLNLEYVFDYKNTKRNFNLPTNQLFNWPAKIGAGYAAKKLGVNQLVFINL